MSTASTSDLSTPRRLGASRVRPVGLGCMNINHGFSSRFLDEQEGVDFIQSALDAGVDHLDTAALYGGGRNEEVVGKALQGRRDEVFLASKGSLLPAGDPRTIDGSPEDLRRQLEDSLRRLDVETLDLYYLHRLDPQVPVEDSAGAMAEFIAEGKIRSYGLSEVSGATLERAHAVHPVAAVQNEYSLWTRNPEWGLLEACRRTGTTLVAFAPVARGFLAGGVTDPQSLPEKDIRRSQPRFSAENFPHNLALLDPLRAEAERIGCSLAQLALAWLLSQGQEVVAIPGTVSLDHLREDLGAEQVRLSPEDLERVGGIVDHSTVRGHRYGPSARASVDTEDSPPADRP